MFARRDCLALDKMRMCPCVSGLFSPLQSPSPCRCGRSCCYAFTLSRWCRRVFVRRCRCCAFLCPLSSVVAFPRARGGAWLCRSCWGIVARCRPAWAVSRRACGLAVVLVSSCGAVLVPVRVGVRPCIYQRVRVCRVRSYPSTRPCVSPAPYARACLAVAVLPSLPPQVNVIDQSPVSEYYRPAT